MARPRKTTESKKLKAMTWYGTAAEKDAVCQAAASAGLSLSEYQRSRVLAQGLQKSFRRIGTEDFELKQRAVNVLENLAVLLQRGDAKDRLKVMQVLLSIERLLERTSKRTAVQTAEEVCSQ